MFSCGNYCTTEITAVTDITAEPNPKRTILSPDWLYNNIIHSQKVVSTLIIIITSYNCYLLLTAWGCPLRLRRKLDHHQTWANHLKLEQSKQQQNDNIRLIDNWLSRRITDATKLFIVSYFFPTLALDSSIQ